MIGIILSGFQNVGVFDNLTQGRYDANSSCGFVQECEEVKDCIGRVCSPYQDAYSGAFYNGCVDACNNDPTISLELFMCENPQVAWETYGYACPNYIPGQGGGLTLAGRQVSFLQIAIVLVVFIIIFLVVQRL